MLTFHPLLLTCAVVTALAAAPARLSEPWARQDAPPPPPPAALEVTVPQFPNPTCPIMGKPISDKLWTDTDKGRIYICCKACIKKIVAAPDKAYQTLRPLRRIFPAYYRFRHRISDAKLEADRATVNAALDRIEQERQGRAYLVGDAFTVADLTAAALLGALLQPPEIQYPLRVELPPYLQDYRAALTQRPAAQWALGIYRMHRGRSAEIPRPSAAA